MSFSAPPGQPSVIHTVFESFGDAYALALKNAVPVIIALVAGLIASIAVAASGWRFGNGPAPTNSAAWFAPIEIPFFAEELVLMIVSFYSLAAAVRTLNPDYRMTVGRFFGFIGWSIIAALVTFAAALFFVIPAYWVGPKVSLTPYTYLVTDNGSEALNRTWRMTTGYYWQTVGTFLLAALCADVVISLAFLVCALGMSAAPFSVIILGPIAIAVTIWTIHAISLIYIRWTNGLLPRASTPQAVPVPA